MNFKKISLENIEDFKNESKEFRNILYFFYKEQECVYAGQTKNSLYDRCFKNTPKHCVKEWFKDADCVCIIKLDDKIDDIARSALEAVFIATLRPENNKK